VIELAEHPIAIASDDRIDGIQQKRGQYSKDPQESPWAFEMCDNEQRGSGAIQQARRRGSVVLHDIHVFEKVGIPALHLQKRPAGRALKRGKVKDAPGITRKHFCDEPIAEPADTVIKDEVASGLLSGVHVHG